MVYTPKYAKRSDIEDFLQITIDPTTKPTSIQVLNWIEEAESGVDQRLLGSYSTKAYPNGMMIDVYPLPVYAKGTVKWFEYVTTHPELPPYGRIIIPPIVPIISVTALYRNTADLHQAPNWEQLTEGPGTNTDFIVLKKKSKTGQLLGFAFYIYRNLPTTGYHRLQFVGSYGWNIPTAILKEYVTLTAAKTTLFALTQVSEPVAPQEFIGGDFGRFVGISFRERINYINERLRQIEEKHFPSEFPMAIL